MQIPQCDTTGCDILLWMADAANIYFVQLSTGEVYKVVGLLMDAMEALPHCAVLGVLMDDGTVGKITPNRLQ